MFTTSESMGTRKIMILKFLDGIAACGAGTSNGALARRRRCDASARKSPPAGPAPDKPATLPPRARGQAEPARGQEAPCRAGPAPAAPRAEPPDDPNVDLVFGAYQRGLYKTAFDLATKRAQDKSDPKAMTMLGELYANAFGVPRDDAKAAEWYKRAADAGDREAMFELAMLRLAGRGGPVNREEAAKLLASSAKLGNPKAAYNLALMYLGGQTLPQDVRRAAELLRVAADAGNPEAQYALATFYKEGRGVPKDAEKAARLLQAARWPAMSMPRSNMRSRCSTALAPPRTGRRRSHCCARPPGRTTRSRRTASPGCWPAARACRWTRSRR